MNLDVNEDGGEGDSIGELILAIARAQHLTSYPYHEASNHISYSSHLSLFNGRRSRAGAVRILWWSTSTLESAKTQYSALRDRPDSRLRRLQPGSCRRDRARPCRPSGTRTSGTRTLTNLIPYCQ